MEGRDEHKTERHTKNTERTYRRIENSSEEIQEVATASGGLKLFWHTRTCSARKVVSAELLGSTFVFCGLGDILSPLPLGTVGSSTTTRQSSLKREV